MCEISQSSLPIIVVLLGATELAADRAGAIELQRSFHASGADDILVKLGSRAAVRLAVEMCIVRTQLKRDSARSYEAKLQLDFKKQLQRELELQEEQFREKGDRMFWQSVDRVFPGFPPLLQDVGRDIDLGAQVGPCRLHDFLGSGTFGSVFLATDVETGQPEAVKVVAKEQLCTLREVKKVWRELRFLGVLDHENIVALYGTFQGPCHVFIRMELAGSRNLFRSMKSEGGRLSLQVAQVVQAQLVAALAHCHSRGVAHRDLKPENIAVAKKSWHIKLLDFGCAAPTDKPSVDVAGTVPFMAPEVMGASAKSPYDPRAADMWSSGIVLLEMLSGKGKLEGLLPCSGQEGPEHDLHLELQAFFLGHPRMLADAIAEEFPTGAGDMVALFGGLLDVHPRSRWTAPEANACDWLQPWSQAGSDAD